MLDDLYKAGVDNDADAFEASFTEDASSILPGESSATGAAVRDRRARLHRPAQGQQGPG